MKTKAWAAQEKGSALQEFEFEAGDLEADQVEIAVEYCGICHSDLSLIHNEWGNAVFPLVPGHEVVGRIVNRGAQVPDTIGEEPVSGSAGFQKAAWPVPNALAAITIFAGPRNKPLSVAMVVLPSGCAVIGPGQPLCRMGSMPPRQGRCFAEESRCSIPWYNLG